MKLKLVVLNESSMEKQTVFIEPDCHHVDLRKEQELVLIPQGMRSDPMITIVIKDDCLTIWHDDFGYCDVELNEK